MARGLAFVSTTAAIILVLLGYSASFDAPFLVPKFAALDVCATLGVIALLLSRVTTGGPYLPRAWLMATGALLATTLLAWIAARFRVEGAPYAVAAVARWGSLVGIACATSVATQRDDARSPIFLAVVWTSALVAIVGLLQHIGLPHALLPIPVFSLPGSTFGNRNIAAEVMAVALPMGVALFVATKGRAERGIIAVALVIQLVFLAVTRTRGAWLGAASGLTLVAWLLRRRLLASPRARVSIAAALVLAAVAAFAPVHATPHDAGDSKRYGSALAVLEGAIDPQSAALRTRVGFWRRALHMIADAPLLGAGPGNWPVIFPLYAEPDAARDGVLSMTLAPRQAHNDLLERTVETGLVGLAGLLVFAVSTAQCATRRLRTDPEDVGLFTAGAAAALVAIVGLSLSSFPLEMPATLLLGGVALGFVVPDASRAVPPRPALKPVVLGVAFLLVVCVAVRGERELRGSYWMELSDRARRGHDADGAIVAIDAVARSTEVRGESFRGALRTSQMLARLRRGAEGAAAARRAIAIEPYAPTAWGALANAELMAGHPEVARDAATRARGLLHDYPLALYVHAAALELTQDDPAGLAEDKERLRGLAETSQDRDTKSAAEAFLKEEPAALPP